MITYLLWVLLGVARAGVPVMFGYTLTRVLGSWTEALVVITCLYVMVTCHSILVHADCRKS